MRLKMKNILFFGVFLLLLIFITGCSSVNKVDKETYNILVTYRQKVGNKCIEYINSDNTMSTRDKETFKTYYRLYDQSISNLKVQD